MNRIENRLFVLNERLEICERWIANEEARQAERSLHYQRENACSSDQ